MERATIHPSRLGAAAGIGFFLLAFASFFTEPGETPELGRAPEQEIAAFYAANASAIRLGAVLFGLGIVLFLWFLATLMHALSRAEETLSRLAFAGGVVTAALFLAGGAVGAAPAFMDLEDFRPGAVQAVFGASRVGGELLGDLGTFARAAFLGGASVAVLQGGLLPRWVGWLGALVALLSLLGGIGLAGPPETDALGFIWFLAFVLFFVWVLVASAVLTLRARRASAPHRKPESL